MNDFFKNTTKLSEYLKTASARKLQLDKTLNRYKMHKSLPVSPVSEERSFSDFVERGEDLKKVCRDIEKFSAGCSKKYEEDSSFSSDSLEEPNPPPRRCVSNNEISRFGTETPKSESFYLNPGIKSSQDSILSCNSLESVLSNESDCKSAPLEALFIPQRKTLYSELTNNYYENCVTNYGGSLPKNYENFQFNNTQLKQSQSLYEMPFKSVKTTQTQTDLNFETPEEIVAKKTKASADFQQKLLKFESAIAQNVVKKPQKGVAFFVDANRRKEKENMMYIPSLESKNRQYKSKFCNVLNNKPEINVEMCEKTQNKTIALTNFNFEKKSNCNQQTTSLDRHLFAKSLLNSEKVCHKPPKAVRRHSSKTRRSKQYEYIRKEDFYKKLNVKNSENTIELSYKEKNYEKDLEVGNNVNILNELYDSLDKEMLTTKMDYDSLEVNLNNEIPDLNMYDSLEIDSKNIWSKTPQKFAQQKSDYDEIQLALENIKILNEIQRKIQKINELVDVVKKNVYSGKVRTLSSLYENLSNSQQITKPPIRRRNLSLPCSVERRLLNFGQLPEG